MGKVKITSYPHNVSKETYNEMFEAYTNSAGVELTATKINNILSSAYDGYSRDQASVFRNVIEKESTIGAHLQTRKLAVSGLPWNVIGDNPEKNKEVEDLLNKAGINQLMNHLLEVTGYGYSGAFIQWGKGGGSIIDFPTIDNGNWEFDEFGNPFLVDQFGARNELSKYNNNVIYHEFNAKSGVASTRGLCRTLIWTYFFKLFAVRHKARFLEKYGIPFIMAKLNAKDYADEDIRDAIKTNLRNIGADGIGVFTEGTSLDSMNAGAQGPNAEFQPWLNYLDQTITLLILGQIASAGPTGGMSEGQIQDSVRRDLVRSDARGLQETINNQILRPLEWFKYATSNLQFVIDAEPPADLKQKGEMVTALNAAGYKPKKEWVEETFGIPLEELEAQTTPPVPGAPVPPAGPEGLGGLIETDDKPTDAVAFDEAIDEIINQSTLSEDLKAQVRGKTAVEAVSVLNTKLGSPDPENDLKKNSSEEIGKVRDKLEANIQETLAKAEATPEVIPEQPVVTEEVAEEVDTENVRSTLEANKDKNFIRRMSDPDAPVIQNEDGTVSSHLMAWGETRRGRFVAYPTLFQEGDKLIKPEDPAVYARDHGEFITFDNKKDAEEFAAGSWKGVASAVEPRSAEEEPREVAEDATQVDKKTPEALAKEQRSMAMWTLATQPARDRASKDLLERFEHDIKGDMTWTDMLSEIFSLDQLPSITLDGEVKSGASRIPLYHKLTAKLNPGQGDLDKPAISFYSTFDRNIEDLGLDRSHPALRGKGLQWLTNLIAKEEGKKEVEVTMQDILSSKHYQTLIEEEEMAEFETRDDLIGGTVENDARHGVWKTLANTKIASLLPFVGAISNATDMLDIYNRVERLKDERYPKDKVGKRQARYDLAIVQEYFDRLGQEKTWQAHIVEGVSIMPAFMIEMALTGGFARIGIKGAQKQIKRYIAKKMAKELGEETLKQFVTRVGSATARKKLLGGTLKQWGKRTLGVLIEEAAGAVTRLPAMQLRALETGVRKKLEGIKIREDGSINDTDVDTWLTAMIKGEADTAIEVFSEGLGKLFTLKKIAPIEKLMKAVKATKFGKGMPSSVSGFSTWMKDRARFDGIIGELGEEHIGDFLRALTGVDSLNVPDEATTPEKAIAIIGSLWPGMDQELIRGGTFSVPAIAMILANYFSNGRTRKVLRHIKSRSLKARQDMARELDIDTTGMDKNEEAEAIIKGIQEVEAIGQEVVDEYRAQQEESTEEVVPVEEAVQPELDLAPTEEAVVEVPEAVKRVFRGQEKGDIQGEWFTPDQEAAEEYRGFHPTSELAEKNIQVNKLKLAEKEDILRVAQELNIDSTRESLYALVSDEYTEILDKLKEEGFEGVHLPKGEDFAPSGKSIESYRIFNIETKAEEVVEEPAEIKELGDAVIESDTKDMQEVDEQVVNSGEIDQRLQTLEDEYAQEVATVTEDVAMSQQEKDFKLKELKTIYLTTRGEMLGEQVDDIDVAVEFAGYPVDTDELGTNLEPDPAEETKGTLDNLDDREVAGLTNIETELPTVSIGEKIAVNQILETEDKNAIAEEVNKDIRQERRETLHRMSPNAVVHENKAGIAHAPIYYWQLARQELAKKKVKNVERWRKMKEDARNVMSQPEKDLAKRMDNSYKSILIDFSDWVKDVFNTDIGNVSNYAHRAQDTQKLETKTTGDTVTNKVFPSAGLHRTENPDTMNDAQFDEYIAKQNMNVVENYEDYLQQVYSVKAMAGILTGTTTEINKSVKELTDEVDPNQLDLSESEKSDTIDVVEKGVDNIEDNVQVLNEYINKLNLRKDGNKIQLNLKAFIAKGKADLENLMSSPTMLNIIKEGGENANRLSAKLLELSNAMDTVGIEMLFILNSKVAAFKLDIINHSKEWQEDKWSRRILGKVNQVLDPWVVSLILDDIPKSLKREGGNARLYYEMQKAADWMAMKSNNTMSAFEKKLKAAGIKLNKKELAALSAVFENVAYEDLIQPDTSSADIFNSYKSVLDPYAVSEKHIQFMRDILPDLSRMTSALKNNNTNVVLSEGAQAKRNSADTSFDTLLTELTPAEQKALESKDFYQQFELLTSKYFKKKAFGELSRAALNISQYYQNKNMYKEGAEEKVDQLGLGFWEDYVNTSIRGADARFDQALGGLDKVIPVSKIPFLGRIMKDFKVRDALAYIQWLRVARSLSANYAWSLTTQPMSFGLTMYRYGFINSLASALKATGHLGETGVDRFIGWALNDKTFKTGIFTPNAAVLNNAASRIKSQQKVNNAVDFGLTSYFPHSKMGGVKKAVYNTAMSPIVLMENFLNLASAEAAFQSSKSKGFKGEDLALASARGVALTQSMYNRESRSQILNSRWARVIRPFVTYSVTAFNNVIELAYEKHDKKTAARVATRVKNLGALSIFLIMSRYFPDMGSAFAKMMYGMLFADDDEDKEMPEEFKNLYRAVFGPEDPTDFRNVTQAKEAQDRLKREIVKAGASVVPFLSNSVGVAGRSALGVSEFWDDKTQIYKDHPHLRNIGFLTETLGFSEIDQMLQAFVQMDKGNEAPLRRMLLELIPPMFGISGGVQMRKVFEVLWAFMKNDGRILNAKNKPKWTIGDDESPYSSLYDYFIALIYGPNGTKGAKQYSEAMARKFLRTKKGGEELKELDFIPEPDWFKQLRGVDEEYEKIISEGVRPETNKR